MSLFRRDKNLVSVTSKIRHKSNCRFVFRNDPFVITLLGGNNICEQGAPGLIQISARGSDFSFDRFEDKVSRINLAVRMRIRDANDPAFIFERQDVIDLRPSSQINIFTLPGRN